MSEAKCTGPFSDAKDCPVHSKNLTGKLYTESDVRELIAKAYERCAKNLLGTPVMLTDDMIADEYASWGADIRSGKEPL